MNFQELIEKYTKLVAKQLYDLDDVKSVFYEPLYNSGEIVLAVCKLKQSNTIEYNGKNFEKNPTEIPPTTWTTIVHEITHYEIGVYSKPNSNFIRHSKEFNDLLKINLQKTKNLRKEFNKEIRAMKKTMPMYQK